MRRPSALASVAFAAALAGVAAFAVPSRARAADAPASDATSQLKAVVAELDTAMKAKDESAVTVAVKKIPPLYKGTTDAAARGSAAKELGAVIKSAKMTSASKAALDALVETEDGKEAWKVLQSAYPADDLEDETRWNVDIVKAIGALHPDGAIEKLLESFKKGKQADFAAAAVTALGNYKTSKQRQTILVEIVKAGKNMVPSRSSSKNPSPEAQARWGTLSGPIGKALDTLTGDSVGDPVEWFKKVDEAKTNLKSLFRD